MQIYEGISPSSYTHAGFSLIEVLVAISILVIAVAAPMVLAARSVTVARYASNEITAFYLAQEGLEYIRLARDDNFINTVNWMSGINDTGSVCKNSPCTVSPTLAPSSGIQACHGPSGCPPLYFNPATGFYDITTGPGWTPSIYTRSIQVTAVSSDEVIVSSTVTWNEGSIPRSFSLSLHLMRWYPGS